MTTYGYGPGDIEGAICDECGNQIGPRGCCGDARRREAEMETLREFVRRAQAAQAAVEAELAALRDRERLEAERDELEPPTRRILERKQREREERERLEAAERERDAHTGADFTDAELEEMERELERLEDLEAQNRRAWKWDGLAEWFATGLTVREWT